MDYDQELERLFENLGFLNFEAFIKTADPLTHLGDVEQPANSTYLLDDLYTDEDEIGYIFIVTKDAGKWDIHSIDAAVQMETVRNIEGVISIGKRYFSSDGPLPPKELIRMEILEMVRIEKIKETFLLNEREKQTLHRKSPRR